jgi:predicted Ser/Thr protein kinase
LNVESVEDLKRMLREMGYSDRAVEEILRWYEQNNT